MAAQVFISPDPDVVLSRFGLLATAAFMFATGFRVFPATSVSLAATTAVLFLYLGAFTLASIALVSRTPDGRSTLWAIATGASFALVCSVAFGILFEIPSYGTDVMAFAHAGGEMLLDGVNPYSLTQSDIQSILASLSLPEGLITQTVDGQPVEGVIYYPALHVLIYASGLAAGISDLRWVTFLFELVGLAILWAYIPNRIRFIVPAVLLLEPYLTVQFTAGGVSDWLWVVPVLLAAAFLSKEDYALSGFWFGLACAVKQQPWFALPFLAIWVLKISRLDTAMAPNRGKRNLAVFASMVSLGFALPNFPFMIWSFGDWIQGVLGPALLDLVPSGQGLVVLLNHGYLGLSRIQFAGLVLIVIGVLCVVYYFRFQKFRNLLWILPAMVMFFAYRSLHNYFVFWIPVLALWLSLEVIPTSIGDRKTPTSTASPSFSPNGEQ